jgi:benzoyl-CoA reductase/2-hydroxyglutaryl-CoA dehydratase subunit BcrC/BadD/HgdB
MMELEYFTEFHTFLKGKKEEGKKIIAFMAHDNIPEEIIDAAGFFPLQLIFAGNDELMNASQDFLPPSTCSFAQSCIGLFSLKPPNYSFLDLIDYFIVSNHCVLNICASEIITKYFHKSRLNFYISYTQNDNALKLEKIKGSEIKESEIFESIQKYNSYKRKIAEINNLKISGKQKLLIFQKAILKGPDFLPELDLILKNYNTEIINLDDHEKNLLLTGCSIFINDDLIDIIEESGGNIAIFDTWIGEHYFSQIFEEEILKTANNPIDLLTFRYQKNKYGDHNVPYYLENKVAQLEKMVEDYKMKSGKNLAIINHIIKFCDHISIMSAFLKNKLQSKGIQILNLERDYSRANKGQLSTRIEAFLEML